MKGAQHMIGKIIGILITGGIGGLFIVLGFLLWKKQMINLLHDYHVDKVTPENRKAFCRLTGMGLIVIGVGLVITAVILGITDSAHSFILFAACFVIGLIIMIAAGMKYNR